MWNRVNNSHLKTLVFDLETAPLIGYAWSRFEVNIIEEISPTYILCFSYRWLGDDKIHNVKLPDFPLFKRNKHDDYALCKKLWELFNEADILVGHNIKKFDIRKANARFIYHGFKPYSPVKTFDTYTSGKKFDTGSNSLKNWAKYKSVHNPHYKTITEKGDSGGFERTKACMNGDKKAFLEMGYYCDRDVYVSTDIYLEHRPWSPHPFINEDRGSCPVCGSTRSQSRGSEIRPTRKIVRRFQCLDCGKYRYEK